MRLMSDRPNILFVMTDQQGASMMRCAGNRWLDTPAMDRLASDGIRFERAYCTDPVCVPSRFSLMTGRMPSEIGLRGSVTTDLDPIPRHIVETGAGRRLRAAGYETMYAGKQHLPCMTAEDIGFNVLTHDERDGLADACAGYLREYRAGKPFFLVASFVNPHDICYLAIRAFARTEAERERIARSKLPLTALDEALACPAGMDEETFLADVCPPLPPNVEPQENEPEAIRRFLEQRPFKKNARDHWRDRDWRLHRWAYCRLTERVDRQIGRVLDALYESGRSRDTIVIFSSDHGDMDGAHRMEHKTAFYEEACRVPFTIAGPGVRRGTVDMRHLVSNGLDLVPTLCDYAGLPAPADLKGRSLRPLAESESCSSWREDLALESEIGRMVMTDRYKYMQYDAGKNREQLMDLENDPHETRNALLDPVLEDVLREHRERFARHFG